MSRTRTWSLGTAVVALLILVAGWFLLVSPKHTEAADLNAQTEAQLQKNATLTTQIATLKAQSVDLPAQEAKLAKIRQQLPDNPALPGLIRTLSSTAYHSGVTLVSLEPANPKSVVSPTTSGSTSGSTTSSGTSAAQAEAPAGSTLQEIDVTINVTGGYFDVEQFVNKVEGLTRSMQITGIAITPVSDSTSSTGGTSTTTSSGDVTGIFQARVFFSPTTA